MKKVLGGAILSLVCLEVAIFSDSEVEKAASWDGQVEHSVVSKEENQKAIEYLEQVVPDALENLPFPIENLTLEKPQEEQNYEAFSSANLRQAKKWYTVDRFSSSQYLIVSNYLVPVGYTDAENGIPIGTVDM
ncbi:hypothetical protein HP934_002455 [Enterococcus faecalis]|nr:hypothetical protein [Enterococcus faecalis]